MENQNNLASRVRTARLKTGMTQTELAESIGVTRSAIAQIESGATRSLAPLTAMRLSEVTGLPARWLEAGEGAPADVGSDSSAALCMVELTERLARLNPELREGAVRMLRSYLELVENP